MKTVAITVLCCVWVVVALGVGIYTFDTPRIWVEHLLSGQEAAVATANLAATTVVTSTAAVIATSSVSQDTSSAAAPLIGQRTTYEYKILTGVTACKLTLLGADGWHPIEFGGTLVSEGYDSASECRKLGLVNSLDWVLLERPSVPAQ